MIARVARCALFRSSVPEPSQFLEAHTILSYVKREA